MIKSNQFSIIFILYLLFCLQNAPCQSTDTTNVQNKSSRPKAFKVAGIPMILATASVLTSFDNGIFSKYDVKRIANNVFPGFHTSLDNFLQFAPIPVVYGLNWTGIKGKNDFWNRSILLAKSEFIMAILVYPVKNISNEQRPDKSDYESFPSGHTAEAFVAATFMAKEFGDKSVWYSIGAYSAATATAALRILNNKHWISDVLMGAGIGIFSTNLAYATHQYRWGKMPENFTLSPTFNDKSKGLYLSLKF
jgi:membrane-associated phospholipid phosphatase